MKKLLAVLFVLFLGASVVHAAAITESWSSSDVLSIDKASPVAYKNQIGTREWGVVGMTGATSSTAGALTAAGVATTITTPVYTKATGASAGEAILPANGQLNQEVTFILTTDGGQDFTVTPATKTGFTSLTLNDAKDACTIRYINSTVGWVLTGNNGCTVN